MDDRSCNYVIGLEGAGEEADVIVKHESRYESAIRAAADSILSDGSVRTVALTGPSCSGKTTTAMKLTKILSDAGRRVVAVSIDDFYLDGDRISTHSRVPDYESPEALDLHAFAEFTAAVYSGQAANLPVYDFETKQRCGMREYIPDENDIYIFEGIQALYPELYKYMREASTKRVFINVESSVTANGIFFSPEDIRLCRRLIRDFKFRASTAEFTLRIWEKVRENEERRILPFSSDAEIRIDSTIPYDLYVMCGSIVEALEAVDLYSPEYPAAAYIQKKLEYLIPYSLPEAVVPADSLIREFIG